MKIKLSLADLCWLASGGTLVVDENTTIKCKKDAAGRESFTAAGCGVDHGLGWREGEKKRLNESLDAYQ